MADFRKQLHKLTEDIHLSAAEKTELRERLLSYTEHRPIRGARAATPSSFSFNMFQFSTARFAMPAVLVAVLVVSSGVSYAAEGTVPGDTLYPVKILVNEEVRAALLVSDANQISWNIRRAERRLEEATALASRGELDSENQDTLATQFAEHSADVTTQVSELEVSNPALALEASSEFEASLTAHEEALDQVAQVQEEGRDLTQELVAQVAVARSSVSGVLALGGEVEEPTDVSAGASMEAMLFTAPPEESAQRSAKTAEPEMFATAVEDAPEAIPSASNVVELKSSNEDRKEVSLRLQKLVSARIVRMEGLYTDYQEELSEENRQYVGGLITNIKMHFETAQARLEVREYAEVFNKLRSLLLSILRIEIYLRSVGEFELQNVEPPQFPSGFPEFTQPGSSPEPLNTAPQTEGGTGSEGIQTISPQEEESAPGRGPTPTAPNLPIDVRVNVGGEL